MSETLWYYRSNVQRIAEILRKRLIFQRDGKIASFTSNKEYQIANKGTQFRVQVLDAGLSSYNDLKLTRKTGPIDHIEHSNPGEWFGIRQFVLFQIGLGPVHARVLILRI
jgi:hypothetical protein